ncbi:hypothetical protein [Sphingobium boeckii]|uniref:Uncharacterized protein n=1 Tax=Sphingobium boeckii TaxID=1082345 RepID=A0A7W9AG11_9SPHN|nr:hypothetical protein [Sphingobium boeckii]MBB5684997.1 hypothetical protein [Sphingobium boeckii]
MMAALKMLLGPWRKTATLKRAGGVYISPNWVRTQQRVRLQPSERGDGLVDIQALMRRIEASTLLLYGDRDPTDSHWATDVGAALRHGGTQYVPHSGSFVLQ